MSPPGIPPSVKRPIPASAPTPAPARAAESSKKADGTGAAPKNAAAPAPTKDSYAAADASAVPRETPKATRTRERSAEGFKAEMQKAKARQASAAAPGAQPLYTQPIDISGLKLSRPADDTVAVRQGQQAQGSETAESAREPGSGLWTAAKVAFGVTDSALTDLGQGLGLPVKPYQTKDPAVRAGQVAGHVASMAAGVAGFVAGAGTAAGGSEAGTVLALTPGGQTAAVSAFAVAGAGAVEAGVSASWAMTGANNLGKDLHNMLATSTGSSSAPLPGGKSHLDQVLEWEKDGKLTGKLDELKARLSSPNHKIRTSAEAEVLELKGEIDAGRTPTYRGGAPGPDQPNYEVKARTEPFTDRKNAQNHFNKKIKEANEQFAGQGTKGEIRINLGSSLTIDGQPITSDVARNIIKEALSKGGRGKNITNVVVKDGPGSIIYEGRGD